MIITKFVISLCIFRYERPRADLWWLPSTTLPPGLTIQVARCWNTEEMGRKKGWGDSSKGKRQILMWTGIKEENLGVDTASPGPPVWQFWSSLWDMRDFVSTAHSAMLVCGVGKVREGSFGISTVGNETVLWSLWHCLINLFPLFLYFLPLYRCLHLKHTKHTQKSVPHSTMPFSSFPIKDKSLRRADTPSSWTCSPFCPVLPLVPTPFLHWSQAQQVLMRFL